VACVLTLVADRVERLGTKGGRLVALRHRRPGGAREEAEEQQRRDRYQRPSEQSSNRFLSPVDPWVEPRPVSGPETDYASVRGMSRSIYRPAGPDDKACIDQQRNDL